MSELDKALRGMGEAIRAKPARTQEKDSSVRPMEPVKAKEAVPSSVPVNIRNYTESALRTREKAAEHRKKNLAWLAEQGIRARGITNASDIKRLIPQVVANLHKHLDA